MKSHWRAWSKRVNNLYPPSNHEDRITVELRFLSPLLPCMLQALCARWGGPHLFDPSLGGQGWPGQDECAFKPISGPNEWIKKKKAWKENLHSAWRILPWRWEKTDSEERGFESRSAMGHWESYFSSLSSCICLKKKKKTQGLQPPSSFDVRVCSESPNLLRCLVTRRYTIRIP